MCVLRVCVHASPGLSRDRLEHMAHLPEPPSTAAFAPVIAFAIAILCSAIGLIFSVCLLLAEASASTLALFLFPAWLLSVDSMHALLHLYLQRRERVSGTSDLLYYATLVPEIGLQCCKLLHHLHVWFVHGLNFSIIDVLLFANTKVRPAPTYLPFGGAHPLMPPAHPPPFMSSWRAHRRWLSRRYTADVSPTETFSVRTPTSRNASAPPTPPSSSSSTTAAPSAGRR